MEHTHYMLHTISHATKQSPLLSTPDMFASSNHIPTSWSHPKSLIVSQQGSPAEPGHLCSGWHTLHCSTQPASQGNSWDAQGSPRSSRQLPTEPVPMTHDHSSSVPGYHQCTPESLWNWWLEHGPPEAPCIGNQRSQVEEGVRQRKSHSWADLSLPWLSLCGWGLSCH